MARAPKLPPFLFDLQTRMEPGYRHLSLRVRSYFLTQFGPEVGRCEATLTWMARNDEPGQWFGGRLTMDGQDLDGITPLLRVVSKACGDLSIYRDPAAICAGLERQGAAEAAYSVTRSRWMPLANLPPVGEASYRDVDATQCCTVHAYCPHGSSDETVRDAIARKMAEGGYVRQMEAWILAGKPIRYMETEGEHPAPWRTVLAVSKEAAA